MNEYPKYISLADKTEVIIRPIEPVDVEGFYNFFSRIPASDLLIYKEDLTKLENLESWFASSDNGKALQLVALDLDRVVAKGSLHAEGLYWSHAAELKLIVDPDYRGKGLGSQLFNVLLCEGLQREFQKIIVRYLSDNASFAKILNYYGFKPETVLSRYVNDESSHDLVIASFDLETWERRFEFYGSIYRE